MLSIARMYLKPHVSQAMQTVVSRGMLAADSSSSTRSRMATHASQIWLKRQRCHAEGSTNGPPVVTRDSYEVPEDAQRADLHALRCSFCRRCGSPMALEVPPTESALRHVCSSPDCRYVDYHNPKMVVGCLVEHEGKVLLCRRALEPCKGLWTLPAGYMELSESTQEGAVRETWEEALARVEIVGPYMHLDIPVIGQAYILFRARLLAPFTFGAGEETLELGLFEAADIPFDKLAFSSMEITLRHWVEDQQAGEFIARQGTIVKKPGASMRDKSSFDYVENFRMTAQVAPSKL